MFRLVSVFAILLFATYVRAQDPFVGHFVDAYQTTTINLQLVQGNYQGSISTSQGTLQVWAQRNGNVLTGQVVSGGMPMPFYGENRGDFVVFSLSGVPMQFFRSGGGSAPNTSTPPTYGQQMPDPYGNQNPYSQGQGQTGYQNQQIPQQGGQYGSGQYGGRQQAGGQHSGEHARIAGSRMHWIQKTSVISSNSGAYGEIDFCPDGRFLDYSEASVSVQGGAYDYNTGQYGAYAGAASSSNSQGTWQITSQGGQSLLVMRYHNGNEYSYYLSTVLQGSWRDGQYKYAMDWGKSQCR